MIESALNALKKGKPVLLYDSQGRENEVDYVVFAPYATPLAIRTMRKDCGGLICLALGGEIAKNLGLPYMSDLMMKGSDTVKSMVPKRTAYGDKPAFSLSVNHRDTYTGITDNDRSLTITAFAKLNSKEELAKNFYAPGHVHLLIAKDISQRRGHTELSVELAKRAGITQAMVLCEMMGDDGNALDVAGAKKYAEKNSLLFVDGGLL